MARKAAIGTFALLTILLMGFVAFTSYYYGVWPKPSLTVDDPVIGEWLQDEDVVIHPMGFPRTLNNSEMYIQKGQREGAYCGWSTRLSVQGSDSGARAARNLATNYRTCEVLIMEGNLP